MNNISVKNPFAEEPPIQENFDFPKYIPLKDWDDVEFTVTFDKKDNTKVILLFARIHEVDYYVDSCPIESSLFSSLKKVKIENISVKIDQKLFPKSVTKKTAPFFRYLLDREKYVQELVIQSREKNIKLPIASWGYRFSKEKNEELVKDLYSAIKKESEIQVDKLLRIGASVNCVYFICSHRYIFSSEPEKHNHWCKEVTLEPDWAYNYVEKYVYSKKLTPLSHAKQMKNNRLVDKLTRAGATAELNEEYNTKKLFSYYRETNNISRDGNGYGGI